MPNSTRIWELFPAETPEEFHKELEREARKQLLNQLDRLDGEPAPYNWQDVILMPSRAA